MCEIRKMNIRSNLDNFLILMNVKKLRKRWNICENIIFESLILTILKDSPTFEEDTESWKNGLKGPIFAAVVAENFEKLESYCKNSPIFVKNEDFIA